MKLRPLALSFVNRRKSRWASSGVDDEGDITTQDGTVDRFGHPASRKKTGGWRAVSFILAEQGMANVAFFGVSINLVIYLTTVMHENNASAANNVSNWNGTGWVFPLIVAFFADSYLGRFWGAVVSSVIYTLGLVMLTVAASVDSLRPPQCITEDTNCQHASLGQTAFLYAGLYVMDLGAGGVQGTVIAFGADQFDEEDEKEKEQKPSFFNWFYQTVVIGSLIASTFFVYIQENLSWGLGWGISSGAQMLGTWFLVLGLPLYRYHKPGGNPLSRMSQVVVAAVRKRRLSMNVDTLYEVEDTESTIKGSRRIRHSNKFPFLDRAALPTEKEKEGLACASPWSLCTVTQVEELKFLLRVLPIFLTGIMYTTCYSQMTTLFIEQGYTMDRSLGSFKIPPASLTVFESVSVIFWVIVYDRVLVPCLRRRTGNPRGISELQRIGIGLALSVLSMTLAAVVAIERLRVVKEHGLEDDTETAVPMSVFWEIPQYFVLGASEVFTYIGQLEFFYDQAPDAIRSLGMSLSMLTNALGNFLSSLLLTIVNHITRQGGKPGWIANNLNRGRVDLFFWLLAILSSINLVAFIFCAKRYQYIVTEGPINRIPEDSYIKKTAQDPTSDQVKNASVESAASAPHRDSALSSNAHHSSS